MKIDKKIHKPAWRVQKGCYVEWFVGSSKGSGIVKKVISELGMYGYKEPAYVIITDGSQEITVSVDNIRIVKTQNTLRNEKY